MRKVTLMVVGIAGLSLLLCGSGELVAQTDRTTGTGGLDAGATGTEPAAGAAGVSPAELRQSVLQLQSEVAQMRQELAQVRAELANMTANTGVGGSGSVVNALYTGKVRSVSSTQLVLLDEGGQPFTVELSAQTRFISNGQRISAQQLKQGTRVRATVDLLSGRNHATEVTTLPER